jgi:hypothetical protein
MGTCDFCGRERPDVMSYTRPRNGQEHGEPITHQLCPLCETSVPDEVQVTRKEMLRVRTLADRRMLKSSLNRGQRILGYLESMGGDHRWHAQVVLADGSRVYFNESD